MKRLKISKLKYPMFETTSYEKRQLVRCYQEYRKSTKFVRFAGISQFLCLLLRQTYGTKANPLHKKIQKALEGSYTLNSYLKYDGFNDVSWYQVKTINENMRMVWIKKLLKYKKK